MDSDPVEMVLTDDDRRLVGRWAADCAGRVLPLFEATAPADARPREAIAGGRVYADGGPRTARLRSLALAAHAAAREAGAPAAAAAARAAGVAAAVAYTHALATTDQAKHVLGAAVYAALARDAAAADPAAGDEEIRWAVEHASPAVREVVRRFPARGPGRTRQAMLYHRLAVGLRR